MADFSSNMMSHATSLDARLSWHFRRVSSYSDHALQSIPQKAFLGFVEHLCNKVMSGYSTVHRWHIKLKWVGEVPALALRGTPSHDDVIKWKHFPRYSPFVRIHRSPVNSTHKGQLRGDLMFSLICVWINGCVNNREAGDLRRYRAQNDVTVMKSPPLWTGTSYLHSNSRCCRIDALCIHIYKTTVQWLHIVMAIYMHGKPSSWASGFIKKHHIQDMEFRYILPHLDAK